LDHSLAAIHGKQDRKLRGNDEFWHVRWHTRSLVGVRAECRAMIRLSDLQRSQTFATKSVRRGGLRTSLF
jgi:hypothetical protein